MNHRSLEDDDTVLDDHAKAVIRTPTWNDATTRLDDGVWENQGSIFDTIKRIVLRTTCKISTPHSDPTANRSATSQEGFMRWIGLIYLWHRHYSKLAQRKHRTYVDVEHP